MEIDSQSYYIIQNSTGKELYYEGIIPQEPFLQDKHIIVDQISNKLRDYYKNLHNGFYYYASKSMGIVSWEDVFCLDDEEWGIIDELQQPIRINLETSYSFFSNGMGKYICLDLSNQTCALWSAKDAPRYNLNFWDVIDEWIVIGFENG